MIEKVKLFLRQPQLIIAFIFLASGSITAFLVYGLPYLYHQYAKITKLQIDEGEVMEDPQQRTLQRRFLQIDPILRQSEDVSFLEGIWQSEPMATREGSDQGVVLNYNMDTQGQGTATIKMVDQVECQTIVKAQFLEDGRLSIRDLEEARCNDQTQFRRLTILCQGEGDQTICEGRYLEQEPFPITLFQQLHQTSSKP